MILWRFAHTVSRWHMTPTVGDKQNLADHSWGVALIVSRYFKGEAADELLLLKAALEHDLAEAIVGDMPKYGRTDAHRDLEHSVANDLGLYNVGLPPRLANWLHWADLLDAGLYAQHQVQLGNQHFNNVLVNVSDNLNDQRGGTCPPELLQFAREHDLCL